MAQFVESAWLPFIEAHRRRPLARLQILLDPRPEAACWKFLLRDFTTAQAEAVLNEIAEQLHIAESDVAQTTLDAFRNLQNGGLASASEQEPIRAVKSPYRRSCLPSGPMVQLGGDSATLGGYSAREH